MEPVSRISALLETARDLTLEAARDVGPRKIGRIGAMPAAQVKKLLEGRNERDVLDGLRRVIAMQYVQPPQPTLSYFPAVLKTLSNPYPSTRPLVYNYLLHHADADPDTALLAVNTIQKSLVDTNPRVRAMALKTMAGIRVPVLSQIIGLAIKRGVGDLSPLVRKSAALACVKCVRLDPTAQPQVEEYLATLLADKQYYVSGAAVQAFVEICPQRLDLIHPVYRHLCKTIVDMDEWGQLATIRLLVYYARRCFPRRTTKVPRKTQTSEEKAASFYDEPATNEDMDYDEIDDFDPDLDLFLQSISPLLQSRNSAVIVAVTRAYFYLFPDRHLPKAIGPLIALLRSSQDIESIALHNIAQIALYEPKLFLPHIRHFLLRGSDPPVVRQLKFEVLTLIFPHTTQETQNLILTELEHFSHSHDDGLVRDSVHAIGRCAQHSPPATARRCLTLMLRQIHSLDPNLVGEAIEVIRLLIQRNPVEHSKTIVRLAKNLDTLTSPTARASVVWLVGEFAAGDAGDGIAADVLRLLIRGYADEDDIVRGQIILLAAKVYLHYLNGRIEKKKPIESPNADLLEKDNPVSQAEENSSDNSKHPIPLLYAHAMLLARYTPSYDIRDRARTYRALLYNDTNTDLASLLLLAPKPIPLAPSLGEARKPFNFGSVSLVVGHELGDKAYDVPDWVEVGDEPDPKLRDNTVLDDGGGGRYPGGFVGAKESAGRRLDEALREQKQSSEIAGGPKARKKETTLENWLEDDEEETSTEETESEMDDDESEYETESEEGDSDDASDGEEQALVQ